MLRSVVLGNSLIYGTGAGPRPQAALIPPLVTQARASCVVGRGLNHWSTVYLGDMVDLYALALTAPAAAGFYFVEGGVDASFVEIGESIAPDSWAWATRAVASGIRGGGIGEMDLPATRSAATVGCAPPERVLGWRPSRPSLTDWIEQDMPLS